MSLYRQPTRSRPLVFVATALVALLVGGGVGFALGRSSAPEPSVTDVVAQLREELRPLGAGLELLPTEYPQALASSGNEAAAVNGDVARITAALNAARPDLRVLDEPGAQTLEAAVSELLTAVREQAPAADVERLAEAARRALAQVPGGR